MRKKDWPHDITIYYETVRARELLTWLRTQGHILHETVKFGKNHQKSGSPYISQQVLFKDANQAMMFKLVWGGK
jgi:hypothetical protein